MTDQPPATPTPIDDDAAAHLVDAYDEAAEPTAEAKAAGEMTDKGLIDDYQRAGGEPGNTRADADAAEIERRNLDL